MTASLTSFRRGVSQGTHICALRLSWSHLSMILTVESENECGATNSEESMCERVNMYGWPGDQVSFLQLRKPSNFLQASQAFNSWTSQFFSLKFPSFSLFLDAFEVLPISLASSIIHVSCKH